mmetsp:Transcript_2286/g.8958  ORF Transcript_2286/g.8958 Transcript_2286/m.8958 type:complete len:231 (+) Transcript_2286:2057-2749(+)
MISTLLRFAGSFCAPELGVATFVTTHRRFFARFTVVPARVTARCARVAGVGTARAMVDRSAPIFIRDVAIRVAFARRRARGLRRRRRSSVRDVRVASRRVRVARRCASTSRNPKSRVSSRPPASPKRGLRALADWRGETVSCDCAIRADAGTARLDRAGTRRRRFLNTTRGAKTRRTRGWRRWRRAGRAGRDAGRARRRRRTTTTRAIPTTPTDARRRRACRGRRRWERR